MGGRSIRGRFLPIQERDGTNAVAREYSWGLNAGGWIGGLLNLNQGGPDYSYLYDGKGNVMAILDGAQSVVASYRYSPFGKLLSKSGTLDQPFTFSTKRYDENTGLNYYGFRYYNPSIGRWLTRDPLGELKGLNLYGFVGNSPMNWYDPFGFYGTNDCSHYRERCEESGGEYYCETSQYYCNKFPKYPDPDPNRDDDFEGWSRCVRQCLQDCDKEQFEQTDICKDEIPFPDPTTDNFYDWKPTSCHIQCYAKCGAQKIMHPYTP